MSALGRLLRQIFGRREPQPGALAARASRLLAEGAIELAAAHYERALQADPDLAAARNELGVCYAKLGRLDEAERAFTSHLARDPASAATHLNLGNLWLLRLRPDRAEQCYRRAIELSPDDASLWDHLGMALRNDGRADEAVQCARKALELDPNALDAGSNLLFDLLLSVREPPEAVISAARRWGAVHAAPLLCATPRFDNDPEPDRALRIGYVSADFRRHASASFVEPILDKHDRDRFAVYCYSSSPAADEQTRRFQSLPVEWREVSALPDADMAAMIRRDRIDILVDLSGHSHGHRLLVFARKPAPVQFTYLGFPTSTGVAAIDYRITDARLDPPGTSGLYVERPYRLPVSLWCYRPLGEFPDPAPAPVLARGRISFGSFNAFSKINEPLLADWAELLCRVPASRLILVTVPEGAATSRVRDIFSRKGIDQERLEIHPQLSQERFRALHLECDIALDPYPCNGGATSCETLWMGVPLVSRAGESPVSRAGSSLLNAIGLGDLAARSRQSFLEAAAGLAGDPGRLNSLHLGLRERMRKSALMDEPGFVRALEALYRDAWRAWLAQA